MDDQTRPPLKARTLLAQAMGAGDPVTKALVPPIHMSATYLRDADNGYSGGYVYGRTDNASVQQVEALLAALEGAAEAMTFASGMAAATSVFLALEKPTHIVASRVMYWGFRSWLQKIGRYGHSISFVETSDLDAVRAAVRPGETGLFWIETPSNPLWTVTDIAAISEIAHDANAVLCVDSTVATPVFTRPIAHGADIVVHSATKYLNGHSDVVAGALAAARGGEFWDAHPRGAGAERRPARPVRGLAVDARHAHARGARTRTGAYRGAAGLPARRSSGAVGAALSRPCRPSRARRCRAADDRRLRRHAVDSAQGRRGGGNRDGGAVKVWKRATSLGGVESLIEHRASIEGEGTPCPADLLRLSVGLEDPDDLFFDLLRALDAAA